MRQFTKALWYGVLLGLIVVLSYVTNQFINMDRSATSESERIDRQERVVITLEAGNITISSEKNEPESAEASQSEAPSKGEPEQPPQAAEEEVVSEPDNSQQNKQDNDEAEVDAAKTETKTSENDTTDEQKVEATKPDQPAPTNEEDKAAAEPATDEKKEADQKPKTDPKQASEEPSSEEQKANDASKNDKKDAQTKAKDDEDKTDYANVREPIEVKTPVKTGRVAVVVVGLGLSTKITERSISYLPSTVTLGFSIYSSDLRGWVEKSLAIGHEVLVSLPLEPKDFPISDPGPLALLTNNSTEKNIETLKWITDQAFGYIGFYTQSNERFTFVAKAVEPVLYHIRRNRKVIVYNNKEENFALVEKARNMGLPLIVADLVVDDEISQESIREQLDLTERVALNKGYAVVIAHAYPLTIDLLSRWIASLDDKSVAIVPLSKIVKSKR
ncbi:MAG: divergent polysaccharide deacetylase family protein [Rickettsiales bacterium]|nr:divergent polysaccharide deacetylase family protein [Rickettsiales bacterium]